MTSEHIAQGTSDAEGGAVYLAFQVVCSGVEASRCKVSACFGSNRTAELSAKGVQGPYAFCCSFRQLTAGAVMQPPQREAVRLPAVPGLEALGTCT